MKTAKSNFGFGRRFFLFALTSLALSILEGRAQNTNPPLPGIRLFAADSAATWAGDPGLFAVVRQEVTNVAVQVNFCIRGSAVMGVDYALIPNNVVFAPGQRT